jgi:hypothetical protein
MAGVHQGEGVENPLIRQLAADPAIAQGTAYRFTGDMHNAEEVITWADHEAAVLATNAGFVDWKFGREVRIARANTVGFVIQRHGTTLRIMQYARSAFEPATEVARTTALPQTAPASTSITSASAPIVPTRAYTPSKTVAASEFLAGDSGLPLLPPPLEHILYVYNP